MTDEIYQRDQIYQRVVRILSEQALIEAERIRPDTTLDELALDSLALAETVFAIEEAFGVSVPLNMNEPERSVFDISTVAQIAAGIRRLQSERA